MSTESPGNFHPHEPAERHTTSDYLANFLRVQGVQRVFGVPGEEANLLIDALTRHGMRFIHVNHEVTAGYAAEASGHISGIPGVCLSTLGPGAANLVSGVSLSLLERSPVLGLSGDSDTSGPLEWTKQRLPLEAMFRPVVRYAATVSAASVTEQLPQAFAATLTYPYAPAYLAFPVNEQSQLVARQEGTRISAPANACTDVSLSAQAESLIAHCRRPVLLAGLGVALEGQGEAVQSLAEQYRAPIVLTPKVKGHVPDGHPLLAGVLGPYGDGAVHALLREADLIIALGLDGVDFNKRWSFETPLLSLGPVVPGDPSFPAVAEVAGMLARLIPQLIELRRAQPAWPADVAARTYSQARQALAPRSGNGLDLPALLEEMRAIMPRDGVLTCDSGVHKLITMGRWPVFIPKTFLISNGLAAMGYALPAALASKLERPAAATVALLGDGSMLMYAGELETLARLHLPVVLVVLNDSSYSLIRLKQMRAGLRPTGVDFAPARLAAMAQSLGVRAWSVADLRAFRAALDQALGLDEPALIEVVIPWESYQVYL